MRKIVVIIFVLVSISANAQIVNKFRDSTWFAKGVRFDSAIYLIKGASNGKVLTSDASGRASWQTFTASGVTQSDLDDSILSVRSIRKVDTLYKNASSDSVLFKINGVRYAILDKDNNTSTFTFAKNATKDSIIATHDGTRSAVKDSIADLTNYATITNLKDSTSTMRGLITSSIPAFTLSKNTNRDSIITVYNGVRTGVKDSSIVTPTFSFGRNVTLDSIYAIYNGTRYAAKDSAPTTSATSTTTFTNKRITARVDSTTSSATPTINTDNVDTYKLTAQAADITSFTNNLTGTPTDDQILHIVIIGTGARAITWGSKFESSTVTLPTTTVSTNRLDIYFIWNTATSKWRCGGVW